jgi:predicted nucleotidyltransferase
MVPDSRIGRKRVVGVRFHLATPWGLLLVRLRSPSTWSAGSSSLKDSMSEPTEPRVDGTDVAEPESRPVDPAMLEEIIRRVVEVAQPDRIILFGSAARGEMGPDSDVDLLVVKRGVTDRGRLSEDIHLRFFGLAVSVDVIVVTPEDVEHHRDRIGSVIGPAVREGREVYAAPL